MICWLLYTSFTYTYWLQRSVLLLERKSKQYLKLAVLRTVRSTERGSSFGCFLRGCLLAAVWESAIQGILALCFSGWCCCAFLKIDFEALYEVRAVHLR